MFVLSLAFVLFVTYVPHIQCAPTQTTAVGNVSQPTTEAEVKNNKKTSEKAPETTENPTTAIADSQNLTPPIDAISEGCMESNNNNVTGNTPVDKVTQVQTYSTVSQNLQVEELTADDQTVTEVTKDVSRYDSATEKQRIATGKAATDQGSGTMTVEIVVA